MAGTPVFRLAGSAASGTSSVSCVWPSHATNDVGLLLVQTEAQATTLVTAGAWVQVSNSPQTTGTAAATNAVGLQVFWARATSGAMPNVSINDAGDHVLAQIITFTNAKTSGNPWDITSGNVKAAASTNISVTGGTTTKALALIVDCIAGTFDSATVQASTWTNASLADYAEITDVATASGGGGQLYAGAGTLVTAGAIPTSTVTLASNSKNAWLRVALIGDDWTGSGGVSVAPTLAGTGTHSLPPRVILSPSSNIAASGSDPTTARLTAPAGKSSGSDFQAGTIQDDTNPAPSLNLTSDKYTELEWCIKLQSPYAVDTDAYEFQITVGGTPLPLYSVTPQVTAGTSGTTGTGAISTAPSLAATATQILTGTGTAAVAPALAASGTGGFIGSGGAIPAQSLTGTGTQVLTGTAAATVTPALAGTAAQALTGTGSVTPVPALAGTAQNGAGATGTGSAAVSLSLSGTGLAGAIGSGGVIPAQSLSGAGAEILTGTGSTTPAQSLSGTATEIWTGTGSATPAPALAATGTASNPVSGGVQITPAVAGAGTTGSRIILSPSANIAAGGTTATTARLVAPSGKTSGANFQAGEQSDDTNPLPSLNLTANKYTELEWCLKAPAGYVTSGEVYEFRVTVAGTAFGLYSVTPRFTLGAAATGSVTPVAALSGAGTQTTKGTGAVTPVPALAALGSTNTTASGGVSVPVPTVASAGEVIAPITGTGSVAVPQPLINFGDNLLLSLPVLSATGTSGFIGSGAVAVPSLALAASGLSGSTGDGAATLQPTLMAVGTVEVAGTFTGSGQPVVAAQVAGTAAMSYVGSGACTFAPTLSGGAGATFTGTGDATLTPSLTGEAAQTQIVLAGDAMIALTQPAIEGTGSVTGFVAGTGNVQPRLRFLAGGYCTRHRTDGKYQPQHDSALTTLGEVGGFEDQHESAVEDLEKAGV